MRGWILPILIILVVFGVGLALWLPIEALHEAAIGSAVAPPSRCAAPLHLGPGRSGRGGPRLRRTPCRYRYRSARSLPSSPSLSRTAAPRCVTRPRRRPAAWRHARETESVTRVGIHHRMQVDLAHPFQVPNEESILVQQLPGTARLYVPLSKAGVLLLKMKATCSAESSISFSAVSSSSLSHRS